MHKRTTLQRARRPWVNFTRKVQKEAEPKAKIQTFGACDWTNHKDDRLLLLQTISLVRLIYFYHFHTRQSEIDLKKNIDEMDQLGNNFFLSTSEDRGKVLLTAQEISRMIYLFILFLIRIIQEIPPD